MSLPELGGVVVEALDRASITEVVERALAEDLGPSGDVTTRSVLPVGLRATGRILAREDGVVCGVEVAAEAFRRLDPQCAVEVTLADGDRAAAGSTVLTVRGRAAALLAGERVALNLLARMSGIATLTGAFVEAVAGTGVEILCTRKTTPGLRALEKYAVRCGGGRNHRFGLHDAVLIKDNHVRLAGGVGVAVACARARLAESELDLPVEIEVETLAELDEALAAGADIVLLDNMSPQLLQRAVQRARRHEASDVLLEASGGVTLETVGEIAHSGVDRISIGALTHSVRALDLSMEVEGEGGLGGEGVR